MTVWFENGASTVHSMILSLVVPPNQLLQQSGAEISKVASFERNPATSRVWQKKRKPVFPTLNILVGGLVVSTPLKNMKVHGKDYLIYIMEHKSHV